MGARSVARALQFVSGSRVAETPMRRPRFCVQESLEREVVAVDNEFSGCLQSDTARMMQVSR